MAGTMGHFQYVSDDGNTYRIRLDSSNAASIGLTASDDTEPSLPAGYEPRYLWVESPGGIRRRLVVGDVADTQWTGAGSTVNMRVQEGDTLAVNWNIRGRVGEKRYRR